MVPMSNRVRALLEHHFALEKAFPVKTRRAQDIVKAVADRAGITRDVSPYVLRHTFATTALQKEISLAAVQKIRPSRSRGPGRSFVEKVGVVAMERPKALGDDLDTVAFTRRGRDNISALHPYVPGVGMDSSTNHLGSRNLYIFESGVYS